jgi:hypothetical protein
MRQNWRLRTHPGVVDLNIFEDGTHAVRRTKASVIYKERGNLLAVQILLGHQHREYSSLPRIGVTDAITLAEHTEIGTLRLPTTAGSHLSHLLSASPELGLNRQAGRLSTDLVQRLRRADRITNQRSTCPHPTAKELPS